MATVLDIVREYLVTNGYDGLFSPGECACKLKHLAPCGQVQDDCRAGHLVTCDCGDHDFHIGPEKTDVVDVCPGDV